MSSKGRPQAASSAYPPTTAAYSDSSSHPPTFSSQPRFDRTFLQKGKSKRQAFELSEHDKREIKESFELFDTKKQGKLDYYELKVCR